MSYTRLKSLFGRLSRRNSSASDTSRPPSTRAGSPVPAHSPLHNEYDTDVHSPFRTSSGTRATNVIIAPPEPIRDRPANTSEPGDAESFVTARTTQTRKRPGAHRRHSSSVSAVPDSPPPVPIPASSRSRRPTSLALRASSVGRYPITGESALAAQGESFHERRVASMSSVEREEERAGWRGGREESRIREGQGRGRERYSHHDEGEGERDTSEYSSRGPPEMPPMIGAAPNPNRSARAFSFLSNFAKRAKPFNLSGGGSGSGNTSSSRVGDIGRKGSGVFERSPPDPEPTPPVTSTSHALIPFSTAGTFSSPSAPPLTALSTAISSQFTPAIDALPSQPIEVLILALTTCSDESQTPSHNPAILARQLAKQLRNPTNSRGGVGVGMPGARGSALISAGALGDVVRNVRKANVVGGVVWDIVGAWVEGDTSNAGPTDAENGARRGGTAIERALLWSALTEGEPDPVFDPDEWAERDRTVRALTDGGRDILGLHRFVEVVGEWVDVACTVIAASHPTATHDKASSSPPLPVYVQAQKAIDASLRLLEIVLKSNAPRFGEQEVVQVVAVFCRAVERTVGPWDAGENLGGVGTGSGDSKEGVGGKDEKGRINQARTA
ncbi:hypothetical protein FRC07_010892, partial [Ceratobasidium sp. 392]